MILRPAGPSPSFHPPTSHPRSKLSPEAMTAIAMSLAFHACVGAYLYAHHFVVMDLPAPPPAGDRPVIMQTVTFPLTPPPPAPREKRQTPHQQAKEPIHVHLATEVNLTAGPTLEVPAGPPGAGSGDGFGQVIPAPPTPGPTVARPKTILNPDWIHKPSGAQLADAYPDRALERGVAGSATLLCTVGVKGEVRDCTVAEETPRAFGFGAAALKLSRWFSIRPQTEDGQPVDGALVKVPIRFGVG